jgi:hypothetical protein
MHGQPTYNKGDFKVWTIDEYAKGRPAPSFLVDGLIPNGEHAMLYAYTSHLKSFVSIHLAMSVATGQPFNGRKVDQSEVVYVAAESAPRLRGRMAAWEKHYEQKSGVHFIDTPIQTNNADDMRSLSNFISSRNGAVKLVILDTISRCAVDTDENAPTQVDRNVNHPIDKLVRDHDLTVLMLHHRGTNSRGPRGCTAWSGWTSTVLYAEAKFDTSGDPTLVTMKTEKQRDGAKPTLYFKPAFVYDTIVLEQNIETSGAVQRPKAEPKPKATKVEPVETITLVRSLFPDTDTVIETQDVVTSNGRSKSSNLAALSALVDSGELLKIGRGKYQKVS